MKNILITGATGLIGKEVANILNQKGYNLIIVSRNLEKVKKTFLFDCEVIEADLTKEPIRDDRLLKVEGVINLLGENLSSKRWTARQKNLIYDSRVKASQNLVQSLVVNPNIKFMLSSSAIGIYGDTGLFEKDESSQIGNDFLSQVCQDWEKPILLAEKKNLFPQVRYIILRTGVVFSSKGGALLKMIESFKYSTSVVLGSGNQWISWIELNDLVKLIVSIVENEKFVGIYNGVSPHPVRMKDLMAKLDNRLNSKLKLKLPSFFLNLILGEMSAIITTSLNVKSSRLSEFNFDCPNIDDCINRFISELSKN